MSFTGVSGRTAGHSSCPADSQSQRSGCQDGGARCRPNPGAAIFFGIALSFKLQAIFFLPVLIIVMVVNKQRLLALIAGPAAFVVMLVPAALAGRDWSSLLMIYPDQVTSGGTVGSTLGGQVSAGQGGFGAQGGARGGGATGGFGQTGSGSSLTQNAPSFYQWVGSGSSSGWKYVGFGAAALVSIGVALIALLRRRPLGAPEIVVLATTVVLAVPFLLPEMHERYFFLADVLTIVMAFYVRRYFLVAVVVSVCSLLSYAPFLWRRTFVPLPLLAFAEFLAVIATAIVFWQVVGKGEDRWLRRRVRRPAGRQHPIAAEPR